MAQSRSKRGFVLIATCIALTILCGLAAFGIDVGRIYVIKSELQAFSDAAALTAAQQSDSTSEGMTRAREAATALALGPHAMKWDLGTQAVTGIDIRFENSAVVVNVSVPAPVIFLRVFQPLQTPMVSVRSVATRSGDSVRLLQ